MILIFPVGPIGWRGSAKKPAWNLEEAMKSQGIESQKISRVTVEFTSASVKQRGNRNKAVLMKKRREQLKSE